MGWTWYLPNDFQFFLLIPLLAFLLYKRKTIGLIFIGVFQAICFGITIYSAYAQDLSPSYFEATDNFYKLYYHRPWARIPPFFVGVIVAVLLYSFKNEEASESKCKRMMDKIDNSKKIRMIMYVSGTILFWALIFIFYPINNYPDSFPQFFNVMFLTFSRGIFTVGMNLVLLPVLMGHNSLMRKFLSMDIFTPLARLTFGAYLVHPTFMLFDSLNTVRGEYMTINYGIVHFICFIVVAFVTSCIFTLLVETPFMNLEKTFLMGGGKKKTRKNSNSQEKLLNSDSTFDGAINLSGVQKKAYIESINSFEDEDSTIIENNLTKDNTADDIPAKQM